MAILPKITLLDLCGPGYIFNARVSARATNWVFKDDPARADAVTGNLLVSMGGMPILFNQDANPDESIQLLHEAGHKFSAKIHRFSDERDHIRQTQRLIKQGWKMVTQHVYPVDEIAPECCLVNPATLSYLNNKESLPELVSFEHVPQRKIVPTSTLLQELANYRQFPIVIKAVTDESSGGGVDIMICNTLDDIKIAASYFSDCFKVVVEDFMKIKSNYCMSYAASMNGEIFYAGASEQIIDDRGEQYGNWLGRDIIAPDPAVKAGYDVMKKAVSRGYVGFAGFDMAVLDDGSVKVFDLNFRYNASTVPLLIYDSIVKHIGKSEILLHGWECQGTYEDLIKTARNAVHQGYLIPTNIYNPTLSIRPNARPMLFGLLCGSTREEVFERNEGFLKQGLV